MAKRNKKNQDCILFWTIPGLDFTCAPKLGLLPQPQTRVLFAAKPKIFVKYCFPKQNKVDAFAYNLKPGEYLSLAQKGYPLA
jgi:hypothetical protein